jgi:HD-GYP domain-containing protein (c-di-GMP phosphodiesterase class II)
MAVSDVFTAITEDRPYRAGMDHSEAQRVLNSMVKQSDLDHDIVELLMTNFDELNVTRATAQSDVVSEYSEICGKVARLPAGRA